MIEFEVDKNHPGLPRLLEAAKKMPQVEMVNTSGLSVRKRQLFVRDAIVEFFDALKHVVGEELALDIKKHLAVPEGLEDRRPPKLDDLLQAATRFVPFAGMFRGLVRG